MKISYDNIVSKVFNMFTDHDIYLIGGSVRDIILGRNTKDYDFTINLNPEHIEKVLKSNGYKSNMVGSSFGVVKANVDGEEIDISTFRSKETYKGKSRKPEVEYGTKLEDDIWRRDFSCNALAINESGEIIDKVNGISDLQDKRIRVDGDIDKTFHEDPLRMLRAIRFASTLEFTIENKTLEFISKNAHLILNISRERWKVEMDKMLCGDNVFMGIEYLLITGLAKWMIPELVNTVDMGQPDKYHHKDVAVHTALTVRNIKPVPYLRWTMLLHDLGKAYTRSIEDDGEVHFYKHETMSCLLAEGILDRFKFSVSDRKKILFLIRNHMKLMQFSNKWSDSAVRRIIHHLGDNIEDQVEVSRADITSSHPERIKRNLHNIEIFLSSVRSVSFTKKKSMLPAGIGTIIMDKYGLQPGKIVGEIKKMLECKILEGECLANKSLEYYKKHLPYHKGGILYNTEGLLMLGGNY